MRGLKAWARTSIPVLTWRDDKLRAQQNMIRALRAETAQLRSRLAEHAQPHSREGSAQQQAQQRPRAAGPSAEDAPSFRRHLLLLRQECDMAVRRDPKAWTPLMKIPRKLRNYQLAASHGIDTPTVYQVWETLAEVRLDDLPDEFVFKSDGGAGGHGVFIMTRVGSDQYLIDGATEPMSRAEFVAMASEKPTRSFRPPFFAEGVIEVHGQTGRIPEDVKIYASYGRILLVMLRHIDHPTALDTCRYRFLDAGGDEILEPGGAFTVDQSIAVPTQLEEMLDAARHLSRAVGLGFSRVDLYDALGGPVLGEITRAPGGPQRFHPALDRAMGTTWLQGDHDLAKDLARGRPYGVLHGPHHAPNRYPSGHVSRAADPRSWLVRTAPCEQWCRPGSGRT
ncbi:ATP-grasp fold amidoligase family protein [Ruania alba]|uniref:TupA-like ATPgrasp n=1 Tax=Ruania alba TaxID=648782 RepID=A0A1H5NA19_9MICO|nr:ATP-grasp fold amidoligase family protein [Ruania alba]SEE98519.1 TupA-like ATPgrasp [Ruania alba]